MAPHAGNENEKTCSINCDRQPFRPRSERLTQSSKWGRVRLQISGSRTVGGRNMNLFAGIVASEMCILGLTSLAVAQPNGKYPAEVQHEIDIANKTCAPDKPSVGRGFVTQRDVTGNGPHDYVLNYETFNCGTMQSFCGSGGCSLQVFVHQPNGSYKKVYDDTVQRVTFQQVQGRPAMILQLHGSNCGKAGPAPCSETLYWNGAAFSPAH